MTPSDLDLVNLAAALYAPQPSFDAVVQVDPLAPHIGVKHLDGCDVVVARGSVTIDDWFRDADSEIGHIVKDFAVLGLLPIGFGMHIADSYAAVQKALRPGIPVAFTGHSLGAPEALYLAAAHVLAMPNRMFLRAALFEPPNPGTAHLASFFARDDISAWWNEGDPVPDLPVPFAPFLPWQPVRPARRFNLPAPGDIGPLARHSIALCQQAVRQAGATP